MREFGVGERSIVHVLREAVQTLPDKRWVQTHFGSATFAELDRLSARVAAGLQAAGLSAGDTLMSMLPDTIEHVAVWVACAKLGVIEVPINNAYRGEILAHVATDCGARVAIVDAAFVDRFGELSGRLGALAHLIVLPGPEAGTPSAIPETVTGLRRISAFADLLQHGEAPERIPAESDVMSIMYTSGTTGGSKGVMVSHAHGFEYGNGLAELLELSERDTFYSSGLPLFHIAGRWGVIFAAAMSGATAAVPPRFSARTYWDDVRRFGATATYLLGAMANFLQRQERANDDADNPLRKVLMCPLLKDVADFAQRFDVLIASAYGSTECNAPTLMPLGTEIRDNQIVGKVRADKFDIMVADERDMPVLTGELGEILVRPKQPWITMLGYWNQPAKTIAAWRNLWLHTGDAGRMDADGNLYFVDRIQDTIRRRGENISSMEVESILAQHPAIAECAVFPVASEHSESEVMAAIVLKPDMSAAPEEVIRFLQPRMPYFMVPRYLEFVGELPKTPTGKTRKNILRDAGTGASTWDREQAGIKLRP